MLYILCIYIFTYLCHAFTTLHILIFHFSYDEFKNLLMPSIVISRSYIKGIHVLNDISITL